MDQPLVFNYTDYQKFAHDHIQAMKAKRAQFSLSVLSRKSKTLSKSSLSLIFNGKRELPRKQILALGSSFSLKGRQLAYFETLVKFNQTHNEEEREFFLKQLVSLRPISNPDAFKDDYYDLISNWHALVLREYLKHPLSSENPETVTEYFKGRISAAETKRALELLRSTGAVVRDDLGKLVPSEPTFKIPDRKRTEAVRNYHQSCLKLRGEILETAKIEDRQFCSVNLLGTPENFAPLQERVKEFRDEIARFDTILANNSRVVQLNVQFFAFNEKEIR